MRWQRSIETGLDGTGNAEFGIGVGTFAGGSAKIGPKHSLLLQSHANSITHGGIYEMKKKKLQQDYSHIKIIII